MSYKTIKKTVVIDKKTVKEINKELQEQWLNERVLFELDFDDGKIAKVNIRQGYPSYIDAEIYQGDNYLDCMEQSETILGEFIFWTDDGEYILEIVEK